MHLSEIDELFAAAKSGDKSKMKKLGSETVEKLNEEQKKTVEKALSDPSFLESLLSSEKAKQIMRKLQGGE